MKTTMSESEIASMIAAVRRAGHDSWPRDLGGRLLERPTDAAVLLGRIVTCDTADTAEVSLLSAALDAARMAQENGQVRGGALIDALSATIDRIVQDGTLTLRSGMALAGA